MMRKTTWLILGVLVIVLLAGGAIAYLRLRPTSGGLAQLSPSPLGQVSQTAAPEVDADETLTPQPTPDADQIEEALQNDDWQVRLGAAALLPARQDIPVEQRTQLLAGALDHEISQPSEAESPDGAYLPTTELVRLQLTRLMGKLGPDALASLRKTAESATGEARERAVLALSYAGDRSLTADVRGLLAEARNPIVRMDAAHLLGEIRDPDARSALKKALEDPYMVEYESSTGGTRQIYPVREQAAGALAALGVDVEPQGDGTFKVIQP